MSRTILSRLRAPALPLLTMLATLSAAGVAEATPFYRETFGYCDSVATRQTTLVQGWKAFVGGERIGRPTFLRLTVTGSPANVGPVASEPIGSNPAGALWARQSTALSIFTDEIAFDVTSLSSVTYEQKLTIVAGGGEQSAGRLALAIGNFWYISDTAVAQRETGEWETVSLRPSELTFGTTPFVTGFGPTVPVSGGVRIPSRGTVRAVGVFFNKSFDRVRIDNFTLNDHRSVAETPANVGSVCRSTAPQTGGGTGGTGGAGTGSGTGSGSGNNDNDGGSTTGGGSVSPQDDFNAPALPNSLKRLCRDSRGGTGLHLVTSDSDARKLLQSISTRTKTGLRDRALVAVVLDSSGRIDVAVNSKRSDYFRISRAPYVALSEGGARFDWPATPRAKRLLDQYIKSAAISRATVRPIFRTITRRRGRESVTTAPLCYRSALSMIKARIAAAHLTSSVTIVDSD